MINAAGGKNCSIRICNIVNQLAKHDFSCG